VASPTLGRAPGVPLVTIVRVPELCGELAPAVRTAISLVSTFQSNGYNVSAKARAWWGRPFDHSYAGCAARRRPCVQRCAVFRHSAL
jgi:hypothetical protein